MSAARHLANCIEHVQDELSIPLVTESVRQPNERWIDAIDSRPPHPWDAVRDYWRNTGKFEAEQRAQRDLANAAIDEGIRRARARKVAQDVEFQCGERG